MTDEIIERVTRDMAQTIKGMTREEARYMVSSYYTAQDHRKRADNQARALEQAGAASEVVRWYADQSRRLESQIAKTLDWWTEATTLGGWARSIRGVGPVITAGMMAHIDVSRAPTAGAVWRYAGLDPTQSWNKGHMRPWNAQLKTMAWLLGESFVKAGQSSYYNRLYRERKASEQRRNEAGEYREQALAKAEKVGKNTDAYRYYSAGVLSPGHIHERAKRWTVKIFLAHYHEAAYYVEYGSLPPRPYILEHGGHAHELAPPCVECIDGWAEARAAQGRPVEATAEAA